MKDSRFRKVVFRILRAFCPNELAEELEGDLAFNHERNKKNLGQTRANWILLGSTLLFFRPGILMRNRFRIELTPLFMLSNYFKVAVRLLSRSKTFFAINIAGLALGVTGALLLFLWIRHELSFEQFHADKDRLFMAWNRSPENGEIVCWETTPRVLAPTLKAEYDFVEAAASFAQWGDEYLFVVGDNRIVNSSGVFTDKSFLTMFTFPLLQGDVQSALDNPNAIVITEKFAGQLFGEVDAFGKTITVITRGGNRFEFAVTGVMQDFPANTGIHADFLISFGFLESVGEKDTFWGNNSVITWVKLKAGYPLDKANKAIRDIEKRHYADGQHIEIFLYPVTQLRLYSLFENGVPVGGRIEIVRMLGWLGVCLVAIACINFVNLSTARAQKRSKEVGVRKVTGAFRTSIMTQFLCEAILLAALACAFSVTAAYVLLPWFNELIGQQLTMDFLNPLFWMGLGSFILLLGVLAGFYPAVFLSSFKPIHVLKGNYVVGGGSNLRTVLVVLQFGFAIMLVASALVVRKQLIYLQNRDSGYSRNNLVYVPLTRGLTKNFVAVREELAQSGTVLSLTKTSAPITEQWSSTGGMVWRGKSAEDRTDIERIYVDNGFVNTAGLTLLQGRDIDLDRFPTDSTAAILNEAALRVMSFASPIGELIKDSGNPIGEVIKDNGREWHVVGVVKDFVFTSPYKAVEPIVIFGPKPKWAFNFVYFRLSPDGEMPQQLEQLASVVKKYNGDYPFEYHFADQQYARKFENMQKTLAITTLSTFLTIAIACLGLYGLAIHLAGARTKEIGIRKVLGGSALGIMRMLSLSFLKPLAFAIVLFIPIAWFLLDWWLDSYAFRIPVSAGVFVWTALAILFISLSTVAVQTIRAARANPVDSLRTE